MKLSQDFVDNLFGRLWKIRFHQGSSHIMCIAWANGNKMQDPLKIFYFSGNAIERLGTQMMGFSLATASIQRRFVLIRTLQEIYIFEPCRAIDKRILDCGPGPFSVRIFLGKRYSPCVLLLACD